MKKHNILGTEFSLVSYKDVMIAIEEWREKEQRHYITFTPPHSVLMCRYDSQLRRATADAALTLPDGIGIILAATLLRYPHHGRVSGPTLMLELCDWGRLHGVKHFFYGGAPGVAEALADRLESRYPGLAIAGTYCPPFREVTLEEDAYVVRRINDCMPDIVWIGLGSPKQEKWMAEHVHRIKATSLIGVGAAFDFHSGRVKWAPRWMRRMGVEWVYRLMREPKRMWRRNINSFVFIAGVLHQCIRRDDNQWTEG